MPAYRQALLRGVAASVEHDSIPLRHDFRTVLDVGANRGQFALFAARSFPEATLLCFEPLEGPCRKLQSAIADMSRLTVFEVALGASSQLSDFHVSAADDSSSLLPIGGGQRCAFPGTHEASRITVQVSRLDQVVTNAELRAPVLLKIDVQGGELAVLEGAAGVLDSIDAVLVEASFVELYLGQPLIDDVWSFMTSAGFTCRGAWSMSYGVDRTCLQGDFLFARSGFDPLRA